MKIPRIRIGNNRYGHHFFFVLALSVLFIGPQPVQAKATRVVIIPLEMTAANDLSFLKDGIHSMLVSRLSWNGRITVLATADVAEAAGTDAGPLDEAQARDIGTRLGADYAVFGSLAVLAANLRNQDR